MSLRRSILGVLAALACSCAAHVRPPAPAPAIAAGDGRAWTYEVIADARGRELGVLATFPAGVAPTLSTLEETARFVSDVEVASDDGAGGWARAVPQGNVWTVPSCATRGCVVRYRFLLADAANALDDVELASAYDRAIEAPPSTWLLKPTVFAPGATYRFRVRTLDGGSFATGVRRVPGAEDAYGSTVDDLELAPYTVFGDVRTHTLAIEGDAATIDVARIDGDLAMSDAAVDRWVALSAKAVRAFYGRFPVRRTLLVVAPMSGDDVFGKTLAGGGATILLGVGRDMSEEAIPRDWVLTHEMTHLAFPSMARAYRWIEEGLATYVEPIARARVGTIDAQEVWRQLVDGLPKGEPQPGDRGLDRTHTWGRTYWGGALFCLMADVAIREQTHGARSLEDALRGILDAGGNGEVRWSLERALATGDRATGTHVLQDLHASFGDRPVEVDLARVWRELGVRADERGVEFDDAAPEAAIRRAITRRD
jgi:hypothetical protein